MSYTPTTWATGDVITAEKLNNMENGIVNGIANSLSVYIVNLVEAAEQPSNEWVFTADKTYDELLDVVNNGGTVLVSIKTFRGDRLNSCGTHFADFLSGTFNVAYSDTVLRCGYGGGTKWAVSV